MKPVYYNEFDKFAARWLRELIKAGHLPAGDVDERSITEVTADDLRPYGDCHFFAGIGGWPLVLARAGWPAGRRVWTGSCPCQPFSQAGRREGDTDSRHLWPVFRDLIGQCGPSRVLGEQVSSRLGRDWMVGVQQDLEGLGYAVGAVDTSAASFGAPHIRPRLYWLADRNSEGREFRRTSYAQGPGPFRLDETRSDANGRGPVRIRLADAGRGGWEMEAREPRVGDAPDGEGQQAASTGGGSAYSRLADSSRQRRQQVARGAPSDEGPHGRGPGGDHVTTGDGEGRERGLAYTRLDGSQGRVQGRPYTRGEALNGPLGYGGADRRTAATVARELWGTAEWIPCGDGKRRRIEPRIEPVASGVSGRVGLLRGYGNALNVAQAEAFVRAVLRV